jgi:Spy/CpxP family protein refolding chaperone
MAILQARIHSEVWALLTPEQQAKAKELKAQRETRMKERRKPQ